MSACIESKKDMKSRAWQLSSGLLFFFCSGITCQFSRSGVRTGMVFDSAQLALDIQVGSR